MLRLNDAALALAVAFLVGCDWGEQPAAQRPPDPPPWPLEPLGDYREGPEPVANDTRSGPMDVQPQTDRFAEPLRDEDVVTPDIEALFDEPPSEVEVVYPDPEEISREISASQFWWDRVLEAAGFPRDNIGIDE